MASNVGEKLLQGSLIAVCLLWAASASAANIVLNPFTQPAPGPVTFQVLLANVPDGADDATVELHFENEADLVAAFASTTGNPFGLPGASTSAAGCLDGASICARFGGASISAVPGPTIVLGELTIQSNGAPLNVVVSTTSRYTDPVLGSVRLNEGAVAGGLPEPGAVVLLAIGAVALAATRRGAAA